MTSPRTRAARLEANPTVLASLFDSRPSGMAFETFGWRVAA